MKNFKIRSLIISIVIFTFVVLVLYVAVFMYKTYVNAYGTIPGYPFSQETLGQFGDYYGGIMNPMFGFLSVCLLIFTALQSRKELELSKRGHYLKQLEDTLDRVIQERDRILSKEYSSGIIVGSTRYNSLDDAIIHNQEAIKRAVTESNVEERLIKGPFDHLRLNFQQFHMLANEGIFKYTDIKAIQFHHLTKIGVLTNFYEDIGICTADQASDIRKSTIEKFSDISGVKFR